MAARSLRAQAMLASAVLAPVVALASQADAQVRKGTYTNEALGFEIRVPDGWTEVPIRIDENWIVAKFLSDKTWISKGKDGNQEHRPLMTIVVFTEDATRFKGWAKEERGDATFVRVTDLPYRDYRDYLKRNLENGYFYELEEEKERDIADVPFSRFEIAQHKSEPKKKLICWVYHGQDMDVAVEFEVLEDRVDRLRQTCEQMLGTFRFLRAGRLASAGPITGGGKEQKYETNLWTKFRDEWKKTPIDERTKIRRTIEDERFEKIRASTPESWKIFESPHFLIVSHADDRFAKRMTEAGEAFRSWCDEHFGGLSDEYVRRNVLRVCADIDEYEAYRWKVSGDAWGFVLDDDREVVTYWDGYNGSSGRDAGFLFDDILEMYLADVDPLLLQYTPSWLRAGMHAYVSNGIMKGRKVEFDPDDFEREDMRELEREGKLLSLKEIMTLDEEAYWQELSQDRRVQSQLTTAFRFVMGPGSRQKPLRNFLSTYMKSVIEVAEKHRDAWEKEDLAPSESAETEAEEEAQRKQTDDRWRKRRKQIHEEVTKAAMDLSDREWEVLNRAYEKFAK